MRGGASEPTRTLLNRGAVMILLVITINPSREFRFEGLAPEDREELERSMEELRSELDQLRRDLGKDLRERDDLQVSMLPIGDGLLVAIKR